jgi:arsenite transporter
MNIFSKFLTIWVAVCMFVGVLIGEFMGFIPNNLAKFELAGINIPIAILIWAMVFPMMLKIDFASVKDASKKPKGIGLTLIANWLIKPFSMFLIASLFINYIFGNFIDSELAKEYIAGAVLLGVAPCTAMVFVWSKLTKGNPAYTLIQVAINNLIILIAFVPITSILLGMGSIAIPMDTLLISILLYVLIPLTIAIITRVLIIQTKGLDYLEKSIIKSLDNLTILSLLATLILIFSFQGERIINNPLHILLIAIPLTIQTFFIFGITYYSSYKLSIPHEIASPSAMIGASNFFELAVAVAISLFGITSGAVLATVVGVLVEVPIMLALVKISNNTRKYFN